MVSSSQHSQMSVSWWWSSHLEGEPQRGWEICNGRDALQRIDVIQCREEHELHEEDRKENEDKSLEGHVDERVENVSVTRVKTQIRKSMMRHTKGKRNQKKCHNCVSSLSLSLSARIVSRKERTVSECRDTSFIQKCSMTIHLSICRCSLSPFFHAPCVHIRRFEVPAHDIHARALSRENHRRALQAAFRDSDVARRLLTIGATSCRRHDPSHEKRRRQRFHVRLLSEESQRRTRKPENIPFRSRLQKLVVIVLFPFVRRRLLHVPCLLQLNRMTGALPLRIHTHLFKLDAHPLRTTYLALSSFICLHFLLLDFEYVSLSLLLDFE